jgi:ribosomal protein S18 acetylase RimI-like enzyme
MQLEWIQYSNNIDWKELSALYKIAPLGDKSPENLKLVFENSLYKIFVYEKSKLVGVGRALADGMDCSYICDVAVHPDYQGMGLGKSIVSKLVSLSKGHKKILLYSVPGKEKFYAKFGFKKMKTAMAIFENQEQAIKWQLIGDEI